jgi:hypothetical protein
VIGDPIVHESAVPEGCRVIKVKKPRKVKTIVQRLEEHHFQRLLVEYPDGTRKTITAPLDEEGKDILGELVPGTGITATLLSFMIFNRYTMASRKRPKLCKFLLGRAFWQAHLFRISMKFNLF